MRDKKIKYLNWLPKEGFFLFRYENEKEYYIGDLISKKISAKITFNCFNVNLVRLSDDKETKSVVLADKRAFGFTSKSTPVNCVYAPNDKFLIFENCKDMFAMDIDILMEHLFDKE